MSGRLCIGLRFALVVSILSVGLPASGMTVKRLSGAAGLGVAVAPDGDIWTTSGGLIREIDPRTGETKSTYAVADPAEQLQGITAGLDGDLWYGIRSYAQTDQPPRVGRITPGGVVTAYSLAEATGGYASASVLLATAADGTVWFTLQSAWEGGLAAVRPGGIPFRRLTVEGSPVGVLVARDGMVWYAVAAASNQPSRLERLSPISYPPQYPQQIPLPRRSDGTWGQPYLIAEAPDGSVWATDSVAAVFHRAWPNGQVESFPALDEPLPDGCYAYAPRFTGIAPARDGNMWAVGCKTIARITPAGQITLFPFESTAQVARTLPDGNILFVSDSGTYLLDPLATITPDFTLSLSASTAAVAAGSRATVTVSTSVRDGFSAPLSLTVSGLPAGVSAGFSPETIASPGSGTSSLTIDVDRSVAPGSYPLTVVASGGGLSHTAQLLLTVATMPAVTRIVPIVLDVVTDSAHYRTRLALANRSPRELAVTAKYTPALGQKEGAGTVTFPLAPSSQRQIEDAVGLLRDLGLAIPASTGSTPQGGTLLLTVEGGASEDEIGITALTASPTREPAQAGFAGLAYSAVDFSRLTNTSLWVFGLRSTSVDRSNLAVFNGGAGPVTVRITLFSGNGDGRSVVFREAETIEPFGWVQYSRLLDEVQMQNAYARVQRVSDDGAFSAYGVVNDNVTNDGSFMLPSFDLFTGRTLTVPVLVENALYRSELILANRGSEPRTLTLTYVESIASEKGQSFEVVQALRPGEQLLVADAMEYLREHGAVLGRGETHAGSLRIRTDEVLSSLGEVFAGVRISSELTGGGRVGVSLPAAYSGEEASDEAFLYGLRADESSRTNVAVANCGEPGTGSVSVALEVVESGTGRLAGTETVSLEPGGWSQVSDLLRRHGVGNGWVRARRTSGTAPWIAYAVVNDGAAPGIATDDGAVVPMSKPRLPAKPALLGFGAIAPGAETVAVSGLVPGSTLDWHAAARGIIYAGYATDGAPDDLDGKADGAATFSLLHASPTNAGFVWSAMDQATLACGSGVVGGAVPAPAFPFALGPLAPGATELRIGGLADDSLVAVHQGSSGGGRTNGLGARDGGTFDADGLRNGTIVLTDKSSRNQRGDLFLRFPLAAGDRIQLTTAAGGGGSSCFDVGPRPSGPDLRQSRPFQGIPPSM